MKLTRRSSAMVGTDSDSYVYPLIPAVPQESLTLWRTFFTPGTEITKKNLYAVGSHSYEGSTQLTICFADSKRELGDVILKKIGYHPRLFYSTNIFLVFYSFFHEGANYIKSKGYTPVDVKNLRHADLSHQMNLFRKHPLYQEITKMDPLEFIELYGRAEDEEKGPRYNSVDQLGPENFLGFKHYHERASNRLAVDSMFLKKIISNLYGSTNNFPRDVFNHILSYLDTRSHFMDPVCMQTKKLFQIVYDFEVEEAFLSTRHHSLRFVVAKDIKEVLIQIVKYEPAIWSELIKLDESPST